MKFGRIDKIDQDGFLMWHHTFKMVLVAMM